MSFTDLLTLSFAGICAIPVIVKACRLEWRFKLGGWFAALYTKWAFSYPSFRSDPSTEPIKERLRWVIRRPFFRPVRFLSRLVHSKMQVPQYLSYLNAYKTDAELGHDPDKMAQARLARALLEMGERREQRRHRRIRCSVCGVKTKLLKCGNGCDVADHPSQLPHACGEHLSEILPPYDPNWCKQSDNDHIYKLVTRDHLLS